MDFAPLTNASLAIQLHVVAAVAAFLLGGFVLFRRKGDRLHRIGGRVWVVLMLVVAISSFFIHTIRLVGPWSPIHLLSIATLWSLWRAVAHVRAHDIVSHSRLMRSTYLGALVAAGLFTFMPGRIMYRVFFAGPQPLEGVVVAVLVTSVSLGLGLWKVQQTRRRPG